ncbi:hypothetical protein CcI6DRAFT_02732 [Frankia sp. CcI6]|nr:hypothetical protein CcI6DRAFT_02732 [Frankia sp. CcI6]
MRQPLPRVAAAWEGAVDPAHVDRTVGVLLW